MRCNTRTNWEFYAVLDGSCGLRFSDRQRPLFFEKTLWVFAPDCSHAWASRGAQSYERVSLHFSSVPYPLDEVVRQKGGWLAKKLTANEVAELRKLGRELEPAFRQPNLVSPLQFERRLIELSLLALAGRAFDVLPPALTELAGFRTERAISWYLEHLQQNPTVRQVAGAIHVSPSHLRRLFWQARRSSPKAVFRRLRLERAKELMSRSTLTLEQVAHDCGYASASHLCRDCREVDGFSPTTWRKRLIDRFVHPLPPGQIPLREYSARPEERSMPA